MKNKVALITGATSGIGAAFAHYYAGQGYDLIITGLPEDTITFHAGEMAEKYNVTIQLIPADFSDDDDITKVEEAINNNPHIEVLINNAGFGLGRPFYEKDIQEVMSLIKVHIQAPTRFIHAVLPHMLRENRGVIISLSSLRSLVPIPRDALYSATKIFHNLLLESLHLSLQNKGIKLQVLCPGLVRTHFYEKIGKQKAESKNRGVIRWMDPGKVVEISVSHLRKKDHVIVIPGFLNKMSIIIYRLLPRKLYYWLATRYIGYN